MFGLAEKARSLCARVIDLEEFSSTKMAKAQAMYRSADTKVVAK